MEQRLPRGVPMPPQSRNSFILAKSAAFALPTWRIISRNQAFACFLSMGIGKICLSNSNRDWKDLLEQLKQGRPLIASLQPGAAKSPLHYVVVTGIDWQNGAVFLNDPARGKLLRVAREDFEKQWRPNRNWMLLALPEKAS